MKANYKNWIPKGMLIGIVTATVVALIAFIVFGIAGVAVEGILRWILFTILLIATLILGAYSVWCINAYSAFSYNGKRQLSRQIVEGTAKHIKLPSGGKGLDVGCGSGALTIACAKCNPQATMTGIDYWGAEYASFSKSLCESNASAEGISNTAFSKGNAVKLDFADETFDAVTSNYVYHNISGTDKQLLLLETLRVLKKGGSFAIHDIMSRHRYGDMKEFAEKLRGMGYEKVELIDTTDGLFMSRTEARRMMLTGSTLLVGKK